MKIRSPKRSRQMDRAAFCGPSSITVMTFVLGLFSFSWAGEIPPYPYQAPPWMVALRDKLQVPGTFDFRDIRLGEAVQKVSAATGVSIWFDKGIRDYAEKRLQLPTISNQPAQSVLSLIAASANLRFRLTEKGVVLSDSLAEDPLAGAVMIGYHIEWVRLRHFPTPAEKVKMKVADAQRKDIEDERKAVVETVLKSIRSTKVSQDFVDATPLDIVRSISKLAKVAILSDPTIDLNASKITLKGNSRSVETVLNELMKSQRLTFVIKEGTVYIAREGYKESEVVPIDWEQYRRAKGKVLDRKLTRALKSSRVCDFVDELAEDLGVTVYPDCRSWGTEVAFPAKTAGLSVRQLSSILKRKQIELIVEPPPHWDRVEGFSIYLLKRKE